MTITESKDKQNIKSSKIEFICPICKSKKTLAVPNSIIVESKQLTTISIARNLVCDHQFQAFVDKNFVVRGYQKVDFEFKNKKDKDQIHKIKDLIDSNEDILENRTIEDNNTEDKAKKSIFQDSHNLKKKKMTLNEIYEEFWEFIDDDNEEFRDFIKKDVRRSN